MKTFLFTFFLTVPAFAWQITLDRTNHIGIRKIDILKQDKGEYFFGSKNLGKTLPPKILTAWKEIEKGPTKSSNPQMCASGKFVFIKKDNKHEQRREGCTEGDAYGRLIQNLEDIRTYANGN